MSATATAAAVRSLIRLNRVSPSDPHSAIDYAQLGSELEHSDAALLMAFHRAHDQSTDIAMRALASFAFWSANGKCERLAGRIDAAMLAERNAETVYQREIKPENRW